MAKKKDYLIDSNKLKCLLLKSFIVEIFILKSIVIFPVKMVKSMIIVKYFELRERIYFKALNSKNLKNDYPFFQIEK